MVDDDEVPSLSEPAKKAGLTKVRVTQIMNLLRLPEEVEEFFIGLEDTEDIRKCSERRLHDRLLVQLSKQMRGIQADIHSCCN